MVGRADARHLVTAEEQRVLPFILVPILSVEENLGSKMVEINDLYFIPVTPLR